MTSMLDEEQVLSGFDVHITDICNRDHVKGDTSFLSEEIREPIRGGEFTFNADHVKKEALKDV